MSEDESNDDLVHAAHCCVLHGCVYSDPKCPVVLRLVKQEHICDLCEEDGIDIIPNPDDPDYDVSSMDDQSLAEEVVRLRKQERERAKERRVQIVISPTVGYPSQFYARFRFDNETTGSFGSSPAEAAGSLVVKSVLGEPLVVERVDLESRPS